MKEEIKVSVIVPVYNVEQYIEKTLTCIVNQTIREIEIILINDCSTDNTIEVIKKFIEKDSRIKLVNFYQNQGSSVARNVGIKMSKGKYITFLDSDDLFDYEMIEKMYDLAIKKNADIVTCGFMEVSEDNKVYFKYSEIDGEIIKSDNLIRLPVVPWNKIYKKELFNDIKFPERLLHQDYGTIPIIMAKSKVIYNIQRNFVKHIVHSNSITYKSLTKKGPHRFDVLINSKRLLENNYMLKFYKNRNKIYPLVTSGIVSKTQVYVLNNDFKGLVEYFNKLDELIPQYRKEVKGYSLNQKIFIYLYKLKAYRLFLFMMRRLNNHYTDK